MINSYIQTCHNVHMTSGSRDVRDAALQPVFASSYHPTLHELFDAIAVQTQSSWRQDGTTSEDGESSRWVFSRLRKPEPKPFAITVAPGWEPRDRGYRMEYLHVRTQMGFDVSMMGSHSTGLSDQRRFLEAVRDQVAQDTAELLEGGAPIELRRRKVGNYDSVFFELRSGSVLGRTLIYRVWAFMVGNRCYRVVSATKPEQDDTTSSDIDAMLSSFRSTSVSEARPGPAERSSG